MAAPQATRQDWTKKVIGLVLEVGATREDYLAIRRRHDAARKRAERAIRARYRKPTQQGEP